VSTKFTEEIKSICRNVKIAIKFEGTRVFKEFDSNVRLRKGMSAITDTI
jgi:hypothetical protein